MTDVLPPAFAFPALLVMGVSGCGKSSVAAAIAQRTGAQVIEGDAFHPEANIRKMSTGIALNDEDRQGWLERLADELAAALSAGARPVLACSALKHRYRDVLRSKVAALGVVFLELTPEESAERVAHRSGHFMPASLVESQFRDLEPPVAGADTIVVRATRPLDEIAGETVAWWRSADIPGH